MLQLPNPAQYIIYDPLTARPDPANPNRIIRDPFPEQHHSARPDLQPGRVVQEQAVRDLRGGRARAQSELPVADAAADRQLLPWRRAERAGEPPVRLPSRLQPVERRIGSSSAAAAASITRTSTIGPTNRRHGSSAGCTTAIATATPGRTPATGRTRPARRCSTRRSSANRFYTLDKQLALSQYKPSDFGLPGYMDAVLRGAKAAASCRASTSTAIRRCRAA